MRRQTALVIGSLVERDVVTTSPPERKFGDTSSVSELQARRTGDTSGDHQVATLDRTFPKDGHALAGQPDRLMGDEELESLIVYVGHHLGEEALDIAVERAAAIVR